MFTLLLGFGDVPSSQVPDTDNSFIGLQREDWRQRPLSMEMVQYARTDAHYLLYIANCLIAEMEQQENGKPKECQSSRLCISAE